MNLYRKLNIIIINLIAFAPFINQTIINGYGLNIYLILSCLVLFILIINFWQGNIVLNSRDLLTILISDIFFIFYSINQELPIFLCYQFLILSSIAILFSRKNDVLPSKKIINYPLSFTLIFIFLIIIAEFNGLISNIIFAARMATEGSVLGLSLIFNFAALMIFIKSQITKKRFYLFLSIFISLISFIFFKTRGPIISYLFCIFLSNGLSIYKLFFTSILGFSTFYFSSLRLFRAGGTNTSSLNRVDTYLKSFNLINENIFSINIYDKSPFFFHNWVIESYWRLSIFSLLYIIVILFIFSKYRNSYYYKWGAVFVLICGLFSFEIETTLFSYSVLIILSIFESKINSSLLNKENKISYSK